IQNLQFMNRFSLSSLVFFILQIGSGAYPYPPVIGGGQWCQIPCASSIQPRFQQLGPHWIGQSNCLQPPSLEEGGNSAIGQLAIQMQSNPIFLNSMRVVGFRKEGETRANS